MAASGALSNYYVDSLITASHESENERYASVNASGGGGVSGGSGRHPGIGSDTHALQKTNLSCTDHLLDTYPSCSFQPKPPVFSASWSPFNHHHHHHHHANVYHPYLPSQHAESRYLRSWLDPGLQPHQQQSPQSQVKLEAPTQLLSLGAADKAVFEGPYGDAPVVGAAGAGAEDVCDDMAEEKDALDQSKWKAIRSKAFQSMFVTVHFGIGGDTTVTFEKRGNRKCPNYGQAPVP
uniref:Hox9 N-terminal activation domain-containing protein n=1 Tax=Knipowitschia caucasica TaxID=637954 RepID=A0AAV2KPP0_KNICA